MTKQETIKIISLICFSYPNNKAEKTQNMAALWYEFFKDDDAKKVWAAVKTHIATNEFIPTIAEIKKLMKPKATAFSEKDYDLDSLERLTRQK